MTKTTLPTEQIHALMVAYVGTLGDDEIAEVILEANSYMCRSFMGGYDWGRFFHLDPAKEDGNRYLVVCGILNSSDDGIKDAEWHTFETRDELIDAALEVYYSVTDGEEPEEAAAAHETFEPMIAKLLMYESQFEQAD